MYRGKEKLEAELENETELLNRKVSREEGESFSIEDNIVHEERADTQNFIERERAES